MDRRQVRGPPGEETRPGSAFRRSVEVRRLGTIPYDQASTLQEKLVRRRRSGRIRDQLLLLEHPHVITVGSSANPAHILAGSERREELGLAVSKTGRGGDVTYHGPGQLVGYPILDLKPDRRDVDRYLRSLEEVLIRVLAGYGVGSQRAETATGVWTDQGKVAAIGVRVSSGWITSHGFALNVTTDLSYFDTIVPCGLPNRSVTSLERLLGRAVPVPEVMDRVAAEFGAVFDSTMRFLVPER